MKAAMSQLMKEIMREAPGIAKKILECNVTKFTWKGKTYEIRRIVHGG